MKIRTSGVLAFGLLPCLLSSLAQAAPTVSADPGNPLASWLYTDPNSGNQGSPVQVFDIAASSGNDAISSITVDPLMNMATGAFSPASSLTLFNEFGQVVGSQSLNGTNPVTFGNLQGVTIPFQSTAPFIFETNVPAPNNTVDNGVGSTVLQTEVSSITYQENGGQSQTISPNLAGTPQYFVPATDDLSFGDGSVVPTVNAKGQTLSVAGHFDVYVQPTGGPMDLTNTGDVKIGWGNSLADAENHLLPTSQISIISITPSSTSSLSEGGVYDIDLGFYASAAELQEAGKHQFWLVDFDATLQNAAGGTVYIDQNQGLDDFTTPAVTVVPVPEPASLSLLAGASLLLARRRRN